MVHSSRNTKFSLVKGDNHHINILSWSYHPIYSPRRWLWNAGVVCVTSKAGFHHPQRPRGKWSGQKADETGDVGARESLQDGGRGGKAPGNIRLTDYFKKHLHSCL